MTAVLEKAARATVLPRFSGHESFACRYAWLPKAYQGLLTNPRLFNDEEPAMIVLGIGKNMVRSLRFWVEAMGVAEPNAKDRSLDLTTFGHAIFGDAGFDPYLEDERTHWLLHWKLASNRARPLFAWQFLISEWPLPEFTRSEALAAFKRESANIGEAHSDVTLGQHLDVFLHTYLPNRASNVGIEESLDGPLVDLRFLQVVGERRSDAGRWEPVYAFRREPKPEISQTLFDFCLEDYWANLRTSDQTLSLRAVTASAGSPGQVFKLPEADVRSRLEDGEHVGYRPAYRYQPSAVQGTLVRDDGAGPTLAMVYEREAADA